MTPTWGFWATEFLLEIGVPVTRTNKVVVFAWMRKENTKAKNNPLATTHKGPGSTNFNTVGVQNFKTFTDGIIATTQTITSKTYPAYADIINAMKSRQPASVVANFVTLSPWGTGPINTVSASNNYDALNNHLLGVVF